MTEQQIDTTAALRIPARFRDVPPAEPEPTCETAEDAAERHRLANEHRTARFLRRVPARYEHASLDDIAPEQNPGGRVAAWLDSDSQTLLLVSERSGVGKTHIAYAIGSTALARRQWVEVWTSIQFLRDLRPSGDPEAALAAASECDLLVLDDLGREVLTDWGQEQIHDVLDTRLNERRRTVITTNLASSAMMEERYGAPLVSRILDDATVALLRDAPVRREPRRW